MFEIVIIIVGLIGLAFFLIVVWLIKILISFGLDHKDIFTKVKQDQDQAKLTKNRNTTLKGLLALKKPIEISDNLEILRDRNVDSSTKALLAEVLLYGQIRAKIPIFLDFLKYTDLESGVKQSMARGLVKAYPENLPSFLYLLSKDNLNQDILCGIVQASGQQPSSKAIPELYDLLTSTKNTLLRAYAAQSLGKLKAHEAISTIIFFADQVDVNSDEELTCFVDAIKNLNADDEAIVHFRTLLQFELNDELLRIKAIEFLGKLDADEVIPDLLDIFSNTWAGKDLKKAATHALIRFNAKNEIAELKSMLDKLNPWERYEVSGFLTNYQHSSMNTINNAVKENYFNAFLNQNFGKKDVRRLLRYLRKEDINKIKVLIGKELLKIGKKEKINIYYGSPNRVKFVRYTTRIGHSLLNLVAFFPVIVLIIVFIASLIIRHHVVPLINKIGIKFSAEKLEAFEFRLLRYYRKLFPEFTSWMTKSMKLEDRQKYFGF